MKEGTELRENYLPTLPPQIREAEGPRRNDFSQEHPLGRGEVPSLRGSGEVMSQGENQNYLPKGGIDDHLYNNPWEATKTTGG